MKPPPSAATAPRTTLWSAPPTSAAARTGRWPSTSRRRWRPDRPPRVAPTSGLSLGPIVGGLLACFACDPVTPSRRLFPPDSERHGVAVSLGLVARRGASPTTPQGPQGHRRRDVAGAVLARAPWRAGAEGPAQPAPRLDLQRMVQPGHHARHRDPVLSRPSAPDETR